MCSTREIHALSSEATLPVVGVAAQACCLLRHSLLLLKDHSGADMLPAIVSREI